MTTVAAFSTDWQMEKIPGVEGKVAATFGGTYKTRCAMPLLEVAKNTDYEVFLSFKMQGAQDGHIQAMNTAGEWLDPDVVHIQRWMQQGCDEDFKRARATGQKIIQDLDDDFWGLTKTNVAYDTTDPIKNPTFNREHYWKGIGASDAIIVSTESLRKRVAKLGVPTYVVRNTIDLNEWQQNDPTTDGLIGWCGGIQWRAHDMQVMKVGLRTFYEDFPGLAFYHGGDSQIPGVPKAWDLLELDPNIVKICTAPLCHIAKYPGLWAPINIALVPLENCAFNQAKSFLKSLEACACGVPYIVSKGFPEQQILIDEGSAGRIANNAKPMSWYNHLVDLLDPEVRAIEGKQNRLIAEKHDIKDRWVDWANVLDEVVAA